MRFIEQSEPIDRLVHILGLVIHVVMACSLNNEEILLGGGRQAEQSSPCLILAGAAPTTTDDDLKWLRQKFGHQVERIEPQQIAIASEKQPIGGVRMTISSLSINLTASSRFDR